MRRRQPGREPRAPPPMSSRAARSTTCSRRSANRSRRREPRKATSDRLELLERLPAAAAVAHRPARGRPEDVLERGFARAAVGTAEAVRLELDELRPADFSRRRRRESALAQLLA